MTKKTFYEFLGVEPEASPEEIKTAVQYLAKKFNPKMYPHNSRVANYFKKIQLVYNVLRNPQKRAAYDAKLAKKMGQADSNRSQKKENSGLGNWEKMVYSVDIHWFGYIEALLLMMIPAYFLFFEPNFLYKFLEKMDFLNPAYVEIVCSGLLVLGILVLQHRLLRQFTTILMITSHRTISKFGLIFRKNIEITHAQFEEIQIKQSILGKILDFGTIKMRERSGIGSSKIKIQVSKVASPYEFKKQLIRIIRHNAFHRI